MHERASPHNPYQFFSTKAGSSPRETVVLINALSGAACADGAHAVGRTVTSKVRELIRKKRCFCWYPTLLPTGQSASANLAINPLILQMHGRGT